LSHFHEGSSRDAREQNRLYLFAVSFNTIALEGFGDKAPRRMAVDWRDNRSNAQNPAYRSPFFSFLIKNILETVCVIMQYGVFRRDPIVTCLQVQHPSDFSNLFLFVVIFVKKLSKSTMRLSHAIGTRFSFPILFFIP